MIGDPGGRPSAEPFQPGAPLLLLCPECRVAEGAAPAQPGWLAEALASARRALDEALTAIGGPHWLHALIGQEPHTITWWQMSIRGVLIFVFALLLVRFARRAFQRAAPVDIILSVLIGSNLSRAFTANAAFMPTLTATAALVAVYWVFIFVSMHSRRFASLVKGRQFRLVQNGQLDHKAMARHGITEDDLREAMRTSGIRHLGEVAAAYLERNGSISMLKRNG